ncbi:MAG: hypothetical protein ACLGSD_18475 [Acidobacteriota bacterium]
MQGSSTRYTLVGLILSLVAPVLCAQTPPGPAPPASAPIARRGRFALQVSVTAADGTPLADLQANQFRLLDNNQPTRIFTVQPPASRGPLQLVLIVDLLNARKPAEIKQEAQRFLRRNHGRLPNPVNVYLLNEVGFFPVADPGRDGNALAAALDHPTKPAQFVRPIEGPAIVASFMSSPQFKQEFSWQALGSLVLRLRNQPGPKCVIWLGDGWIPVTRDPMINTITELSTRMREASVVLDWVMNWTPEKRPDWLKRFPLDELRKPPINPKQATAARLALPVLALNSGGSMLLAPDEQASLVQCVHQAAASYTLTFDPADTRKVDDFHSLQVSVAAPGAVVHTVSGYYDEPSYYDHPNTGFHRLSVADLDALVRSSAGKRESDLAKELPGLELTQRLSTPHLQQLLRLIRDRNARQELMEVSDRSAFLSLPAAEIIAKPAPSLQEQRAMIQRTFNYLSNVIPQLPNFFARRKTVFYHAKLSKGAPTWKTFVGDPYLYPARTDLATVYNRDGKELLKDAVRRHQHGASHNKATLQTTGDFGNALSVILRGVAGVGSSVVWDHWEHGPQGAEAVYRFSVPVAASRFAITFCCTIQNNGKGTFRQFTAYHGELAVDPATGAILRLAEQSDIDLERYPGIPVSRSALGIEYAPVDIGGHNFICPVHSFSVMRGRQLRAVREWGDSFFIEGPFEEMVDDITYSHYHKFGSVLRILPTVDSTTGQQLIPATTPAPQPH